jgi:hypothetical protein
MEPASGQQARHGQQALHGGDRVEAAAAHAVGGEQQHVRDGEQQGNDATGEAAQARRPAHMPQRDRQGDPGDERHGIGERKTRSGRISEAFMACSGIPSAAGAVETALTRQCSDDDTI